jgi:hypothetical protein
MDQEHEDLLGQGGRDDADARGEHDYPDKPPPRKGPLTAEAAVDERRGHYAAGADGTQEVAAPEGAGENLGRSDAVDQDDVGNIADEGPGHGG